jgi:hypothetical protein
VTVLTAPAVLALASQYSDWDAHWVVFQVFDAGTGNGESSGKTDAFNAAGPYRGIMQIWDANAIRFGYQPAEMFDPAKNLDVAHRLWLERGMAPWPSSIKYRPAEVKAMNFPPDEAVNITVPWLKGPRPAGTSPRIIIVHATRGASAQAVQYAATKSWFNSTGNGSAAQGWGGCATIVIGQDGQKCTFMDELREVPRFSAGYGSFSEPNGWCADYWGLSMELAQSAAQEDFDPRTIERAAMQIAEWCKRYGIDPVHRQYLDQRGAQPAQTGIVGHDELENGRKLGKTDPGPKFPWTQFMARVGFYMGSAPQPIEEEIMPRFNAVVPRLQGAAAPQTVQLTDFDQQLPPCKRLKVEIYLSNGRVVLKDSDGRYAGRVGWDGARYGVVEVDVSGGSFGIDGDPDATLAQVGVVAVA